MKCKKCGSDVPKGVAYCTNCGTKAGEDGKSYAMVTQEDAHKELREASQNAVSVIEAANDEARKAADSFITESDSKKEKIQKKSEDSTYDIDTDTEDAEESVPALTVNNESGKESKKGIKIKPIHLIFGSVVFVVLIIASIFLFSASARNGLKRAFMSDIAYFRNVERNTIDYLADNLRIAYEDDILELLDLEKSEYSLNIDLTKRTEANRLLDRLNSINKMIDFEWLEKASLSADVSMRENKIGLSGKLLLNKENILDIDASADLNENKAFVNIPILTSKYLELPLKDDNNILTNLKSLNTIKEALPSGKVLRKLILKYADIILSKIDEVEVMKEDSIEAVYVQNTYYMMKAKLSEEKQREILGALLDELEKDNEILAVINHLERTGLFGEKFTVDYFFKKIKEMKENLNDRKFKTLRLKIWVDNSGDVIAQELLDDDRNGYAYRYVTNDGNFGLEIGKTDSNSKIENGIKISGTLGGSKLSGMMSIIKKYSETNTLTFEDVHVKKLLKGNPSGRVIWVWRDIFNDSEFKEMKLSVDFDLTVRKSWAEIVLTESGKTLAEAEVTLKKSSASKIKLPSESDREDNILDIMDTVNFDKILKNAKNAKMSTSIYYDYLEDIRDKGFSNILGLLNGIKK